MEMARYFGTHNEWFVGGALGGDTYALEILAMIGQKVTVIVPAFLKNQPKAARRVIKVSLKNKPHKVSLIEMGRPDFPLSSAYYARNLELVNNADLLLGFPSSNDGMGGTWATVKMGRQKGLDVCVLSLDGTVKETI